MATCKTHEYEVTGIGEFPVDMLRYDGCWPSTDVDVAQITDSLTMTWRRRYSTAKGESNVGLGDEYHTARTIRLLSHRPPTVARWRSFGWKCSVLAVR